MRLRATEEKGPKNSDPPILPSSDPLLDTWAIAAHLNPYFLDNADPVKLYEKVAKSKSVAGHFAHIHTVRLMWLKAAAPDLMEGLEKVEETASLETIKTALAQSADRIGELVKRGVETGKIKGFKPHPTAFVGYLIAHEAFHRAQAELALRQLGAPLPDKAAYGLWEWGVR